MKTIFLSLTFLVLINFGCDKSDTKEDPKLSKNLYLGQTPPGEVPVVFAPGVISRNDSVEERLVFSKDGKWLFFNQRDYGYKSFRMMYMKLENEKWTNPMKASFFEELNGANSPSFSPDGNKLFFDGTAINNETYNPYVMELVNGSWSQPTVLTIPVSRGLSVQGPNITDDGTVYFSKQMNSQGSNYDIYFSEVSNGVYADAKLVIKNAGEDCFVTKDNSLIIFNSYVLGGFGSSDLYITFHKNDGTWSNPKNLGSKINSGGNEYYPTLSPDYKYLFFTNWYAEKAADIYWVKIDNLIDSLKAQVVL